ncbi:MAG: alpha/beta hydrolase [Planctomycetota bacterium]
MSRLVVVLLFIAGAYALLCLLLFLVQRKLVYFPGPPPEVEPTQAGLPYQDLTLVTRDGEHLHAWLIESKPARGVVLFSHGNAGNIAYRLEGARVFVEAGVSVLLYDYRGYGRSTGSPGEEGTYLDAEAAYEHLVSVRGFAPDRVIAYGESLGAAVAVELALRRRVAGVIAESPFTSLPDLAAAIYPWLPARLLCRLRYDSASKVERLGVPILVIHSRDDEIVPFELGRRLYQAAAEPKRFLETRGGHNDGGFLRREEDRKAVRSFIDELLD